MWHVTKNEKVVFLEELIRIQTFSIEMWLYPKFTSPRSEDTVLADNLSHNCVNFKGSKGTLLNRLNQILRI